MIDVHPPHETAHTWKDFFIHVATICVGLLIAIGLEQSVELFHHHHQAAELVEALRQESRRNGEVLQVNAANIDLLHAVLRDDLAAMDKAATAKGAAPFPLPALPSPPVLTPPFNASWITLQQNGMASAVPGYIASNFYGVNLIGAEVSNDIRKLLDEREHLGALLTLHSQPGLYSVTQRETLQLALADYDATLMRTRSDTEKFLAVNSLAVDARSEVTLDQVVKAYAARGVLYQKPLPN